MSFKPEYTGLQDQIPRQTLPEEEVEKQGSNRRSKE